MGAGSGVRGEIEVVEDLPGLDLERLTDYLHKTRPKLVNGDLTGALLPGGRSNLTYLLGDDYHEWVLRRPPLGHVLATAHDMAREYRVISALAGTPVPVPGTVLHCPDPDVLGAPFYLMEKVDGTVYRDPTQTATLAPAQREQLAHTLIDTLAALHQVDPSQVGLSDFGRPDGFLTRQVRRWRKQLASSHSREVPGINELGEKLAATIPVSPAPTIVHGDYRLDNVLVRDGTITAVLDWEMSTLGDPLTDLGLLVLYWDVLPTLQLAAHRPVGSDPAGHDPAGNDPPGNDPAGDDPIGLVAGVGPRYGFPEAAQLVRRYADRADLDLSTLDWYVAMASFKLAVILEGIHYRYAHGLTVGDGFDQVGTLVPPLVAHGLAALHHTRI